MALERRIGGPVILSTDYAEEVESILHVDMDAFYASVEVVKDPSLRGRPVVVGGLGGRGVVTSASYEARAFGVHAAMPIVRARRLCPQGAFVPNDFESYRAFSERIKEVFLSTTPLVEPLSLDEAFLDVSGSLRLLGAPVDIATRIRREIAALGLTCTVGIAPNKFLAKLASTRAKPDGLLVVASDRIEEFLHPLPVTALWGVGEQTADALGRLGLASVGDVAALPGTILERVLGDALGRTLHDLARGIDRRPVTPHEPAKSVGSEETFTFDLDHRDDVVREILRLSDRTATRLRAKGMCGRTVTLKVRFANFRTITRSRTLDHELDTGPEIYQVATGLYDALAPERPRIRLVGVSVSGLAPGPPRHQMSLLEAAPRWSDAAGAVDRVRARFGDDSLRPARLIE